MRTIECPECREPMIVAEYGSVEIDSCPVCGGIWLDGGELESLVGSAPPPKETADADLGPPDRDCPICVDKLVKDRYGATGVVVDRCPNGDGVWLDQGELEQILAATRDAAAPGQGHDEQGAGALAGFFDGQPPKPPET